MTRIEKGTTMKLGILVNTDQHLAHLQGLVKAAAQLAHQVDIFMMDAGTFLLDQEGFEEVGAMGNVTVSICDHSAKELGVDTAGRPDWLTIGSQFNHATIAHEADRMIVL